MNCCQIWILKDLKSYQEYKMKINQIVEGVGRITKQNQTVDVGPNEIKTQAAKFGNTVDRDGRPPTLSTRVKGKSTNVLYNLGMVKEQRYTAAEWAIMEGGHSLDDLDKPTPTISELVKKHGVPAKQILKQLEVGIEHEFSFEDWYWCPKHKDTPRQFECHTSITPNMVIEQINDWLE